MTCYQISGTDDLVFCLLHTADYLLISADTDIPFIVYTSIEALLSDCNLDNDSAEFVEVDITAIKYRIS